MNDYISVSHKSLFSLCSLIHSNILVANRELKDAEEEHSHYDEIISRFHINCLNSILDSALELAPDDIRDFFRHYEELVDACPF